MYYHFGIARQIARIARSLKFVNKKLVRSNNKNEMSDFKDGQIYTDLLSTKLGASLRDGRAFTLLINTDGISSYRHSKLSIWPVYLVINELPIEERFCIENVIVAGLSVGEAKPNVDIFFLPIVKELKRLEYGIHLKNADSKIDASISTKVTFHLVSGVYDKPARSWLLNMISSTGFFGCTKCLQPGESLKTAGGVCN
jgi:hypothetical protein